MSFNFNHVDDEFGFGNSNSISPWGVFPVTAKQACEEELGGIIVPNNPLNNFTFNRNGYLFTSDSSVYSGEQSLNLQKLMSLEEPFFAFGQPPGYGLNSYEFVIYYTDKKRVFMMNIPHGGAFMDNKESAKKINEAFKKLEEFISSSSSASENNKRGLFYKHELGGFSPIFDIDCKSLEFREVKSESIK